MTSESSDLLITSVLSVTAIGLTSHKQLSGSRVVHTHSAAASVAKDGMRPTWATWSASSTACEGNRRQNVAAQREPRPLCLRSPRQQSPQPVIADQGNSCEAHKSVYKKPWHHFNGLCGAAKARPQPCSVYILLTSCRSTEKAVVSPNVIPTLVLVAGSVLLSFPDNACSSSS